jgi:hypothetical protein
MASGIYVGTWSCTVYITLTFVGWQTQTQPFTPNLEQAVQQSESLSLLRLPRWKVGVENRDGVSSGPI